MHSVILMHQQLMGWRMEKFQFLDRQLLMLIQFFKSPIAKAAAPHVIIVLTVISYVVFGTFAFMHLDSEIANQSFNVNLLFTFTTISTIGYGNIAPKEFSAQMFCMAYVTLGIPLLFLALGNLGKFLASGYWTLVAKMRKEERNSASTCDSKEQLPIVVIFFLLLMHTLLGGLFFPLIQDDLEFKKSIYFSFISFTTIGYGDIYPTPRSGDHMICIVLYLTSGMVIMSTFVSALGSHLQRIHYLGRPFKGAQDVDVWFGSQCLTVTELLQLVAAKFHISPGQVQSLLRDLDAIIEDTRLHSTTWSRHPSSSTIESGKFCYHQLASEDTSIATIIPLECDDSPSASQCRAKPICRPKLRRCQSSSSWSGCGLKGKRFKSHRISLGNDNHDALFKVLGMVYQVSRRQTLPRPENL